MNTFLTVPLRQNSGFCLLLSEEENQHPYNPPRKRGSKLSGKLEIQPQEKLAAGSRQLHQQEARQSKVFMGMEGGTKKAACGLRLYVIRWSCLEPRMRRTQTVVLTTSLYMVFCHESGGRRQEAYVHI